MCQGTIRSPNPFAASDTGPSFAAKQQMLRHASPDANCSASSVALSSAQSRTPASPATGGLGTVPTVEVSNIPKSVTLPLRQTYRRSVFQTQAVTGAACYCAAIA